MSTIKIGDSVSVPGSMHGVLKYIGPVDGKRGIFAGVQLAPEYSSRGKNSGDVDGKFYFRASIPGSGIFLPVDKAEKRGTSTTGQALGDFNRGGRTPSLAAGSKPNFSQSIGPGGPPSLAAQMRSASPAMKAPRPRRESLPRPSSPLRKAPLTNNALTPAAGRLATPRTRPSLGLNKSTLGPSVPSASSGMRSPGAMPSPTLRRPSSVATNRFGQSLRASTRVARAPGAPGVARSEASASTTTTDTSPLGPESSFDEEEENMDNLMSDSTPTPAAGRTFKASPKPPPAAEVRRLQEQLAERDHQLSEQAGSIREMELSLAELQRSLTEGFGHHDTSGNVDNEDQLPRDVQTLRAALRDKNERIKALTAEFDANRADFRSTIDTLELASTETERVYEKRVDELLEEVRLYQEKNEDVESVALQFKQLEELVQELEEGLEDARRGEAEARGEVEFLRGEVERGRSELRREKERNRAGDKLNGIDTSDSRSTEELDEMRQKIDQKDDEIRGLKAIVQNLNNAASAKSPDREKAPRPNGSSWRQGHAKQQSTNTVVSVGQSAVDDVTDHLQQQILDLETLLDSKSFSQDQLRQEVSRLRQSVQFGGSAAKANIPGLSISQHKRTWSELQRHRSTGGSSASTARPGSMRSTQSGSSNPNIYPGHRRKDTGVPDFVDTTHSPLQEEFKSAVDQDSHSPALGVQNNIHKTPKFETASVSGHTDASSNNALWCEICEESGHDIITCSNMGYDTGGAASSTERTSTHNIIQASSSQPGQQSNHNNLQFPNRHDQAPRDLARRSRESPHPPPDASVPLPPIPAPGLDRSDTSTTAGSNPVNPSASPRKPKLLDPPSNSKIDRQSGSTGVQLPPKSTAVTAAAPPTSNPKLLEGTGDQAGMLGGRESGVIDADKWCALCERDGHDSLDCPLELAF